MMGYSEPAGYTDIICMVFTASVNDNERSEGGVNSVDANSCVSFGVIRGFERREATEPD